MTHAASTHTEQNSKNNVNEVEFQFCAILFS